MAKFVILVAAAIAFWFFASSSFEETFGDDPAVISEPAVSTE